MTKSIKYMIGVIESVDEEELRMCSDRMSENVYIQEWDLENRMLGYLYRWWVKKHNLPVAVRAEITKWIRDDGVMSKFLEPLAVAVEKNNRELLTKEDIEI